MVVESELPVRLIVFYNIDRTEMKVWSLQLCLWFKQSQLSPKKVFEALTGFEPMASALALQCSTNWAMKTHTLGEGQFIELVVRVKGMKHMNIMWTADKWILCELRTYKLYILCELRTYKFVETPKTFFGLNCDCLNHKHNCDDHTFISVLSIL